MITEVLKVLKEEFQVEEYHIHEIYRNPGHSPTYTAIYRKNGTEVKKEITIG